MKNPQSSGAERIKSERLRQMTDEGYDAGHDLTHASGELNDAAICYAKAAAKQARGESHAYLKLMVEAGEVRWPWEDEWWKPSADQIRNLEKAGALIAAEIDRLLNLQGLRPVNPEAEQEHHIPPVKRNRVDHDAGRY